MRSRSPRCSRALIALRNLHQQKHREPLPFPATSAFHLLTSHGEGPGDALVNSSCGEDGDWIPPGPADLRSSLIRAALAEAVLVRLRDADAV